MNWKSIIKQIEHESDQVCSTCKETKPAAAFHRRRDRNGNMRRRAQCRVCFHRQRGKKGERCRNG